MECLSRLTTRRWPLIITPYEVCPDLRGKLDDTVTEETPEQTAAEDVALAIVTIPRAARRMPPSISGAVGSSIPPGRREAR